MRGAGPWPHWPALQRRHGSSRLGGALEAQEPRLRSQLRRESLLAPA